MDIKNRTLLSGGVLLSALVLCPAVHAAGSGSAADRRQDKEPERPNILWLTFEDTSFYEFGCYGNKSVCTPNIDIEADPWELNVLSSDPRYAGELERFRKEMPAHIRKTADLGFFLPVTREKCNLHEMVRKEKYPLAEDENPYVAAEAAYAIVWLGKVEKGLSVLVEPREEKYRKVGYSALESLSLHPEMCDIIRKHCLESLKEKAETLPHKENEDAGLMARGILVNLGELDINLLHGEEAYMQGLKLNHGRRAMVPLP